MSVEYFLSSSSARDSSRWTFSLSSASWDCFLFNCSLNCLVSLASYSWSILSQRNSIACIVSVFISTYYCSLQVLGPIPFSRFTQLPRQQHFLSCSRSCLCLELLHYIIILLYYNIILYYIVSLIILFKFNFIFYFTFFLYFIIVHVRIHILTYIYIHP